MSKRRVGTFTLGITLIIFGVLFLLHIAIPAINYLLIFRLWPILFILLGTEILYYLLLKKEDQFKYDLGAIFIVFSIAVFTMGMAGVDLLFLHYPELIH